jgi:hypothetical protein
MQRLVVGAVEKLCPLAVLQAPFTTPALQPLLELPVAEPLELLVEGPDELPVTVPPLELLDEFVLDPELEPVELDAVPELELVCAPLELALTVPELLEPATTPLELELVKEPPELVLTAPELLDPAIPLELDVLDPLDEAVAEPDELELLPMLCA